VCDTLSPSTDCLIRIVPECSGFACYVNTGRQRTNACYGGQDQYELPLRVRHRGYPSIYAQRLQDRLAPAARQAYLAFGDVIDRVVGRVVQRLIRKVPQPNPNIAEYCQIVSSTTQVFGRWCATCRSIVCKTEDQTPTSPCNSFAVTDQGGSGLIRSSAFSSPIYPSHHFLLLLGASQLPKSEVCSYHDQTFQYEDRRTNHAEDK
jgi:hypothetical protein